MRASPLKDKSQSPSSSLNNQDKAYRYIAQLVLSSRAALLLSAVYYTEAILPAAAYCKSLFLFYGRPMIQADCESAKCNSINRRFRLPARLMLQPIEPFLKLLYSYNQVRNGIQDWNQDELQLQPCPHSYCLLMHL